MLFSPLPGLPIITQGFGQHPEIYSHFGYIGHNGFDYGVAEGTPVFAPHDGVATVKDDGSNGYGLYVVIDSPTRRSLLGHLSKATVMIGQTVSQGNQVGLSGTSGMSTAPHLHWTFKLMKNGIAANKGNGFDGAMDCSEVTRLWQMQSQRADAQYTDDAKPYLSMSFLPTQSIKA